MDWLIKVVDIAMLSDNYYFTCDHCPEKNKYCQGKFCENIKRQLIIERDNKNEFGQQNKNRQTN